MSSLNSSLIFLLTLRRSLSEVIDLDKIDSSEKIMLKNYFLNEATDYEILYFTLTGSLPKKIGDEEKVFNQLHSVLKEQVLSITKHIDLKTIESIINEVDPLGKRGLSSSIPVLEFLVSNHYLFEKELVKLPNIKAFKKDLGSTWNRIKKEYGEGKSTINAVWNFLKQHKGIQIAGAALVVSLLSFAAYRIYRNQLSKAAKACKNFTGPEKNNCMKKFKLEAMKRQLDTLRSGVSACDSSKDPEKCRKIIQSKIKKLEDKISNLSRQV